MVLAHSLQSVLTYKMCRFGPLSDEKSSNYTRQIVQGLHYLHTNNVAHRLVILSTLKYCAEEKHVIMICYITQKC